MENTFEKFLEKRRENKDKGNSLRKHIRERKNDGWKILEHSEKMKEHVEKMKKEREERINKIHQKKVVVSENNSPFNFKRNHEHPKPHHNPNNIIRDKK